MPSRKFREAGPILYGRYDCRHGEWLEATCETVPPEAYPGGFLPFARLSGADRHLFYMGRSLRVDLGSYSMDKKRRYEQRQWQAFRLQRNHLGKETFINRFGDHAARLAREWMEARFGVPYLDEKEFHHVMEKPFLRDILTWELDGDLVAFALIVKEAWGAHYWFSFYRQGPGGTCPPGHGYLGDFLDWARTEKLAYAYLGTSYGLKSRYKSKGMAGVEFWDGDGWNRDRGRLSNLLQEDDAGFRQPVATGSGATKNAHYSLV